MRPVPIPFGPWEPDRAAFQSNALTDALNVVPVSGGYGPTYDFQNLEGVSLPTPILGAEVLSNTSEGTFIYAGSGDELFLSENGAAFTSIYSAPGPVSDFTRWQFARFVGKAIAVNPEVAPVGGDLGDAMTPLGGSPPPAKAVGVVGDFLVLGDLDDGIDGLRPNRVRWSGFRNPNAWGTDVATQADFNDMPDEGGVVQAIIGREFGTVFQRYSISRMTYVGPPLVFRFDVVEKKRGAVAPGSVIDAGLIAAYIADDGFFLWDGTSSTPIGDKRVNEYFRNRIYPNSEYRLCGAFDPLATTVSWAYATDDTGVLNERLIYNLNENRWTRSDLHGQWFMSGFDIGYTLEQLDQFGELDELPFSLDDPRLRGGRARGVGFDEEGNYGPLVGTSLQGVIETGDFQTAPGKRADVNGVRPQVDAVDLVCAIGARAQSLSDPVVWTADSPLAVDGACPLRSSGRFMRSRTTIRENQTWSRATGVEVNVKQGGKR